MYQLNQKVKAKKNKNLPKIAAQYIGQVGHVASIKTSKGCTTYRVKFENGGEALYLYGELRVLEV